MAKLAFRKGALRNHCPPLALVTRNRIEAVEITTLLNQSLYAEVAQLVERFLGKK